MISEATGRAAQICGVPVHRTSLDEAAEAILAAARAGQPLVVHLCNAYVLSLAARDAGYRRVLASGHLNLADGAPVAWTLRRLGMPLRGPRPSGPDVFAAVLARSEGSAISHYLYGGSPDTLDRLHGTIQAQWPDSKLAGAESPPYRPLTSTEYRDVVDRLRSSGADVVWVGIGTPKQDEFIERLRNDVEVVLVPVGAAFDFVAGTRRRAPQWMRRLGIEWIFRLATEPRRLWKRYLVGNAIFLWGARDATTLGPDRSDRSLGGTS